MLLAYHYESVITYTLSFEAAAPKNFRVTPYNSKGKVDL